MNRTFTDLPATGLHECPRRVGGGHRPGDVNSFDDPLETPLVSVPALSNFFLTAKEPLQLVALSPDLHLRRSSGASLVRDLLGR
jgi:hypothetical protein